MISSLLSQHTPPPSSLIIIPYHYLSFIDFTLIKLFFSEKSTIISIDNALLKSYISGFTIFYNFIKKSFYSLFHPHYQLIARTSPSIIFFSFHFFLHNLQKFSPKKLQLRIARSIPLFSSFLYLISSFYKRFQHTVIYRITRNVD